MRTRDRVIVALLTPVGLLVVAAVVVGLVKSPSSKPNDSASPTTQPSPRKSKTEGLACLSKGLVDTCQEIWVQLSPEVPADAGAEVDDLLTAWEHEKLRPSSGCARPVRFSKSCAEQFPDDPAVATCAVLYTTRHKQRGDIMVHSDLHFYDARAAGNKDMSSALMKACEERGGNSPTRISQWDTVSLSSPEYVKAYKRTDQGNQGAMK